LPSSLIGGQFNNKEVRDDMKHSPFKMTPSIIALTKHSECLVGLPAKRQAVVNSQNTIFAFKRLISQQFNDKEVRDDMKHLPFKTSPSIVAFTKHGKGLVGLPAKQQAVVNLQNTVFAFKYLISRRFNDEVRYDMKHSPFKTMPPVVVFTKHGEGLVGLPAKRQASCELTKHRLCLQAFDWSAVQ
jgi:molecular chaperone DnaK (HSP70)